jgi:hypothetical protein
MHTQSAAFWRQYMDAMNQLFQTAMRDPAPIVDLTPFNRFQFTMSALLKVIQGTVPETALQTLPAFIQADQQMAEQLAAELLAARGQPAMACSDKLNELFIDYFAASLALLTEWVTTFPESALIHLSPLYELFQQFACSIEQFAGEAGEPVQQALNAFWVALGPGRSD